MLNRWVWIAALLVACETATRAQAPQASPITPAVAASSDVTATPEQASLRPAEPAIDGLIRFDRSTVALTLAKTKLLLYDFEFNGDVVATDKLHFKQLAPGVFEITSIAYTVGEWRVRIRDAANFYGLGERSDTLNHSHTVIHNVAQSHAGAKGSGSLKPVPFFMSTTGYGVWFDVTGDATFDMNATNSSNIVIDADAEKLRIVLFSGSEFSKILDSFTAQAGRAILPPFWAFAPWLGRAFQSDDQIQEVIDKGRSLSLPASVIVDGTSAPSPSAVKRLHDDGYKLILTQAPSISLRAPGYADAAASGFFIKTSAGTPYLESSKAGDRSLVDFTNSRARLWWQDHARATIHAGADGFKLDDAAGEFIGDLKFNDESDSRVMRNRYAVLYNDASEEVIKKDLKGDGVLLVRNTTTGANGLGFLWEGDTEASFNAENGLPAVVTAGLNAGISGMSLWTADVGGSIAGTAPDPQLFMRWTEYAAFSPVMQTVSAANLLPWDYGTQALAVYRKFSTLHMGLFPYRYAAAQQAAKTGMPIMRALVLAYQDDDQARRARNEYMFGPDLLVAPIVDEGTQRTVYLPPGEWLDYWTSKPVDGGHVIVADAAVDSIPVYVRQGAVLPKLPEDVMTLVPASESGNKALKAMDERRVYEIFGAGEARITDFEGRTLVHSADAMTINGDAAARIILRWRFQRVAAVTVNGAPAALKTDALGVFVEFDYTGQSEIRWR